MLSLCVRHCLDLSLLSACDPPAISESGSGMTPIRSVIHYANGSPVTGLETPPVIDGSGDDRLAPLFGICVIIVAVLWFVYLIRTSMGM